MHVAVRLVVVVVIGFVCGEGVVVINNVGVAHCLAALAEIDVVAGGVR